jgi:hypothetical protein
MVSLIFKFFGVLFATIKILIFTGLITATLVAIQTRAFNSRRHGLISMSSINSQLFDCPAKPTNTKSTRR